MFAGRDGGQERTHVTTTDEKFDGGLLFYRFYRFYPISTHPGAIEQ